MVLFHGVLHGTECVVLPDKGYVYIPLDVFISIFIKEASLSATELQGVSE